MFENVKVVLVRTWSPGNLGSIIRVCKNFGITEIYSANQINHDNEEMLKMAAGAKDHACHVKYRDDLEEVLSDCSAVFAFTNRVRKHYEVYNPNTMATEIFENVSNEDYKVALMFGNETNGLNDDEMNLADKIVNIDTTPEYGSLNLAAAVTIALHEIYSKYAQSKTPPKLDEPAQVTVEARRNTAKIVSDVIVDTVLTKKIHADQFRENIEFIFRKAKLTTKEVYFIKSLFKLIEKRILRK